MDTFGGLPSHPLFVHGPLVLVPLLTLLAVALLARPAWRRSGAVLLAGGNIVAMVMIVMAEESGEFLTDALGIQKAIHEHQELAETTKLFVIGFLLLSVALFVVVRRSSIPLTAAHALGAATVVLGLLATIWMFRTGHAGAKVVWDGVLESSN